MSSSKRRREPPNALTALSRYARTGVRSRQELRAYLRRSGAYAKLEQWAKAIKDIDRAIELVPALAKSDHLRKRRAEYVKKAEE